MDLRSLWRRIGGSATDGAAAAGSGAAEPARPARPSRPAWRDVPPIARAVRPAPLVARTVEFGHELTGHQPAPLALEPLGHEVHHDAPSGIASGLATLHPVSTDGAERGPLSASVRQPRASSRDERATAQPPRLAGSSVAAAPVGAPPAPTARPTEQARRLTLCRRHGAEAGGDR